MATGEKATIEGARQVSYTLSRQSDAVLGSPHHTMEVRRMSDFRAGVRYLAAMLSLTGIGFLVFITWRDSIDVEGDPVVRAALNSSLYMERGFWALCIGVALVSAWMLTRAEE
jgi:hypothetical protein